MQNKTSIPPRWPLPLHTLLLGVAFLASLGICNPQSPSAGAPDDPDDPDVPDVPINASVLACGAQTRAASAITTTITPAPNALVLVWVGSLTPDPTNLPTIIGGGMTWELVETHIRNAGLRRLSVFRGMSSAPSGGLLTIDFDGQEQDVAAWGVVQHMGVNTSGVSGSGAIVQTGAADADGLNTFATIDLDPFSSAGNATVGGFLAGTAEDISPGDGFVEVFESGVPRRRVMVEFQPSPSTSVDASWPDPNHWIGIALELKAASNSGGATSAPSTLSLVTCGLSQLSGAKNPAGSKADAPNRPARRGVRPPRQRSP